MTPLPYQQPSPSCPPRLHLRRGDAGVRHRHPGLSVLYPKHGGRAVRNNSPDKLQSAEAASVACPFLFLGVTY